MFGWVEAYLVTRKNFYQNGKVGEFREDEWCPINALINDL
jgi:hypothetical protein